MSIAEHEYSDKRGRNLCDACDRWMGDQAHSGVVPERHAMLTDEETARVVQYRLADALLDAHMGASTKLPSNQRQQTRTMARYLIDAARKRGLTITIPAEDEGRLHHCHPLDMPCQCPDCPALAATPEPRS